MQLIVESMWAGFSRSTETESLLPLVSSVKNFFLHSST